MITTLASRSFWLRPFLLLFFVLAISASSFAQVSVAIAIAPPELPVYDQPVCPDDGYIWVPGYWAWDGDDYYWVPGTWVLPPEAGFFWTPGYWEWVDSGYIFHDGFWGPEVGFYGGINYGFGYFGVGYVGGRWDHGHFFYNRAVSNVNVTIIHNVYNETVVNRDVNVTRVSFNGGRGGITARPTPAEAAVERGRHVGPTNFQVQQMQQARGNRELRASANQGRPPVAATARPGDFNGGVAARGGNYTPPPNRGGNPEPNVNRSNQPAANIIHSKDMPPITHMPTPNTGDSKMDDKYLKQQDKLFQQQQHDQQRLQQQQDRDHQRMQQQQADQARQQQMEQRHQQQTQQLMQRQTQQTQRMQERQQPRGGGAQQHR